MSLLNDWSMAAAKTDCTIGGCNAVARGEAGATRSRLPMTFGKWWLLGDVDIDWWSLLVE